MNFERFKTREQEEYLQELDEIHERLRATVQNGEIHISPEDLKRILEIRKLTLPADTVENLEKISNETESQRNTRVNIIGMTDEKLLSLLVGGTEEEINNKFGSSFGNIHRESVNMIFDDKDYFVVVFIT